MNDQNENSDYSNIRKMETNSTNGDYKEIKLGGKRGGMTLVSNEDYERLSKCKWYMDGRYVSGYVPTIKRNVGMHHFIMNAEYGQHVDHINGITTDNRRSNLRFLTPEQHAQNRHISKINKTSKYRGVSISKSGKYQVVITLNNVDHYLGVYDTEIEAAYQWDHFVVFSKLLHIELNFPERRNEYLSKEYVSRVTKREYIGVHSHGSKYKASVKINNKNIYLGTFKNQIDAARKHDDYIVTHNIIGKRLNFQESYSEYGKEKIILTNCEEINDATVKLLLSYKNDKFVTIDKEDYDKVKYHKCFIGDKGYPFIVLTKKVRLYRYLLGVTDSKIHVDHIDSNPYNNKKDNLRLSNYSLNSQNKSKQSTGTTSKYIGVSYRTKPKKWFAEISNNHKKVLYTSYADEEMCARARDLYILENLKGTHYKLNFKWSDDDKIIWKEKLNALERKCTSSYSGVCFNKQSNKWKASVTYNGKYVFSKQCAIEEHAARAHDLYILLNLQTIISKFKMNFEWTEIDIIEWKKLLKL